MRLRWMAVRVIGCVCAIGAAASAQGPDERQMADTQNQLITLLRVSPTLTGVVERDPSLLADAPYVSRANPALEQFLVSHPEVVRNPDFYLFSGFPSGGARRQAALERKIWPEYDSAPKEDPLTVFVQRVMPILIFFALLAALLWLIQLFVRNRRWHRTFTMQMEAQEKLIDRFSSNEQLMLYMETAGKQLLQAPALGDGEDRMPNVVSRVLLSAQIGVVLTLLGIGVLGMRHSLGPRHEGFAMIGILFLMPGLGFLVSAWISWLLAKRLGLFPLIKSGGAIVLLLAVLLLPTFGLSQTQVQALPSFEVATIRPNAGGESAMEVTADGITINGVTLATCLKWAYDIQRNQIVGANSGISETLNADRYDIVAKSMGKVDERQLKLMLQSLLATRFQLRAHKQERQMQSFILVIDKGGRKFRESQGDGASQQERSKLTRQWRWTTMPELAATLSDAMQAPVLDETGLTARYDFALDLSTYSITTEERPDIAAMMVTAVREELGLKLEAHRAPVELLIVDRAEKPTAN